MLDNTNTYQNKGLIEILRYFHGDKVDDEEKEKLTRPRIIDSITLEIIRQFPRPCLNCMSYLEQPMMTPREHKIKQTCQLCGDYLCESCLTRTGHEFDITLQAGEFAEENKDLYDDTENVKQKIDLTSVCCSICCKFFLDPIRTLLADGGDRTCGAESNVIKHVKKFREGLQPYPFAFKGIIFK